MLTALRLMVPIVAAASISGCYVNLMVPAPEQTVKISAEKATRTGYATCTGFLGVFATGDCSVSTAMENGRISKVHHVDSEVQTVLFGAYSELTTIVYGE